MSCLPSLIPSSAWGHLLTKVAKLSLPRQQSQSTTPMVIPFSQAGGMRLDHVYGTFLSLRRPQTPQDAATATAPRPPKVPPAAAIIPRPLPAPVIAPTPAPVNALLPDQPHPSQGILATSSSGAACSVYYIYGAAQAVALAARAAGTPFDPRSLDLPSIGSLVGFMPVLAFQSNRPGLMPSKQETVTCSKASPTPMPPNIVRTQTK